MPSQPPDPGWDFSSVIDLIDSEDHNIRSPTLRPTTRTRPLISVLQQDGGVRLGSFAKLYENLGLSNDVSAPALPPLDLESELSNSDETLLPSPVLEGLQAPVSHAEVAEYQPANHKGMSKKQRKKARQQAEKAAQEQELRAKLRKQLQDLAATSTEDRDAAIATPSQPRRAQSGSNVGAKIKPASSTAIPATEKTVTVPSPQKEPKTPKTLPRPVISKRSSTAQSIKPVSIAQAVEAIPEVQAIPLVSIQPQYTALSTPAPLQNLPAPQLLAQLEPSPATSPTRCRGLVPRNVRPAIIPRPPQHAVVPHALTSPTRALFSPPIHATPMNQPPPITIRSQVDRHFHLFNKLLSHFPEDRKWLVSPMQLVNEKTTAHGLHAFVDASNIMYGFKDTLRTHGIYQPYDMSFDSLALIMERRRPVGKRVFAGSHREANPLPQVTKLFETSRAVGYESNVKEQVLIVREESEKKKFFNDVKKVGWHKAQQMRSGSGSDSETGPAPAPKTPSAPKWVEQGVDEILHLKMCQSIIDTEAPSTMILASGDGAEAEMSDGFLAHVERALKRGWKVELISWRQQTNGGYRNKKFRTKWADSFRIIELDDFLEDLIDTP